MVLWSRNSDRTGERYWHAALACLIAAIGMAIAARAGSSAVLAIAGLSLTAFGVSAAKPPLWCLPTTFFGGTAAAASIGLINSLGTLGGFAGPYMIGATNGTSGNFTRGLYLVGGTLIVSARHHPPHARAGQSAQPTQTFKPERCLRHASAKNRANRIYKIAVIPGDGIGKEVVPEGVRVLEAAAKQFDFELQLDEFDFASCDYYLKHNKMLPDDWKEQIGHHDAIFFGAVGWPEKVPDHISLWGSLILFRREFDQYVNLRPVRLMPGVPCPLAGRKPGDIDFFVVRENTEGEYSSIGGSIFPGTDREVVVQETVMTRIGVDRILKFAFNLAQRRPKKHLTSATKSNGISITMPYWDERVVEMAKAFPDVSPGTNSTSTSSPRTSSSTPTASTSS